MKKQQVKAPIPMFKSQHNLVFESAPYELNIDEKCNWQRFRVGTCNGLWCSTATSYDILAIVNNKKGNGHLNDVLQWFEQSCIRDKKSLRILAVWNQNFKQHLVSKRQFQAIGEHDVIKYYN